MKKTLAILFLITISFQSFAQCWSEVAAGLYHCLAIKSDGTLWAWGLNDNGQLGDGTTVNKNIPTQIGSDTDWAFINALNNNSLALKTDGSLWAWGQNNAGQNGNGNFGDGVMDLVPTRIGADTDWIKIGQANYAIKSNGTLWGWGANGTGSLGTGDTADHYTPVQIGTDSDWVAVSIGGNQRLAVKSNGTLWGWGLNKTGSLAIGPVNNFVMVPTQTGNGTADWAKITVGGCCSSKMIKIDGTLWAMGSGDYGNLGNGSTLDVNFPTQIGQADDWEVVSTSLHSLSLKNDGTLWAWGLNAVGELGNGTAVNSVSPLNINNEAWVKVAAGYYHSVALRADGTLHAWGRNNYGQLGDGTLTNKNVLTQIGSNCSLASKQFLTAPDVISVYPNPVAKQINIVIARPDNSLKANVTLSNIIGETIFDKRVIFYDAEAQVDMGGLAPGIYILKIQSDSALRTFKVIKQ